ncbi:autotransporter domain-containing protein [Candidatus Pelagibacter sp.]|nr:autotransporter domain-containing protein [Candidatus Pelagibacter sp.]
MTTETIIKPINKSVLNKFRKIGSTALASSLIACSTLGVINTAANAATLTLSANSAQGSSGINSSATLTHSDNVNLVTFTLTVSEALDLATNGLDAITGTTGTLTFTLGAGADSASVASFVTSGAGNFNVTNLAGGEGAFTVTSDGVLTTVGGTVTVTGDTNTAVLSTLDIDGTTAGGVGTSFVLDETATKGTSLLSLTAGSGNTTLTGNINGAAAGEGAVDLSASGTNAITGAIGNDFKIRLLDIDSVSTFSSTVDAVAIDADNTATFAGDVNVTTMTSNVSGKVVTFNGDFTGTTLTIDTSSVDANKDVTSNVVLANAAGDLLISGAVDQTLTGTVTATDGEGSLIVSNAAATGSFTATGQLGVTGARLLEVSMSDGSNAIFQSLMFAETLDIDSNTAAEYVQVTAGNVIGTNGGTAGAIEIAAGATIRLDSAVVDGTTVFDLQTAGTADAAFASADAFTVIPSSSFNTGTVEFIEGGTNSNILDDSGTDGSEVANHFNVQDSAIIDYEFTAGTTVGADVLITATEKTAVAIGTELNTTSNEGLALLRANQAVVASGVTADITIFDNVLNAFGSETATSDTTLAKQIAPQVDTISGSSIAAQSVTGSVQGIMSNRMASLRSGDAYYGTGVAAGGMSAKSGFIQVFGSTAEQESTKVGSGTQAGFDTETQGLAIGFDGVSDDGLTVGVSVATANTDVDGKGTGKSTNSIDTYSASIYMDTATDAGYIEGSVTFGVNENTTSRRVAASGINRTYTGSYDSQSLSLNLSAGMPNEVGAGYLTPFGSLTATSMDIDAYTEKSTTASDPLRLKVAQDDINSVIGTVGVKFHGEMSNGGMPMISLAINNEFGDNTINSTNTFQGGGTAFKTSTAVEELSATLGLGYSYGSDSASIEFAYEADANDDDYLSHYGSIKIVSKF